MEGRGVHNKRSLYGVGHEFVENRRFALTPNPSPCAKPPERAGREAFMVRFHIGRRWCCESEVGNAFAGSS